ncbi:MAG: hypothetical protein HS100_21945 [Anaerolineales bacterium]|nr:hypothetical protein [Anaerolineales bacterium]
MNLNSIWSDCKESYDLLNKVVSSVYRKMIEEKVVPKGFGGWGPFVVMFPDGAVTFEKYQRIFPYDAEQVFHESFSVAAQEGYLSFDGSGYRATDKGEEITQTVMRAFTDAIAPLQPMPQSELKRLVDTLIRLCEATDAAPEPPSHFCQTVYKNYKRTFPSDAPLPRLFIHYFKELDFHRMDSHMAARRIRNIEGNRWEVFSEVWGGKNNTLDKIFDELGFRGISRDEYASILQELVAHGWIEETAGGFQATAEGKRIREEAEALTDKYFFAPWNCLSESELEELAGLASQLRDGLNNPVENRGDLS